MNISEFGKKYLVHVYETGPDGLLNIHSLCNFLQDIASDHAVKLGFGRDDLIKNNSFWVLSRLAVSIDRYPEWGEEVLVKTWPRGTDRLFALRDFELFSTTGEKIASASSSWLVVDIKTKRIQRPDSLLASFSESKQNVRISLGRNAGKVDSLPGNPVNGEAFTVKISELDVNLHVNNVAYLKWITDNYDLEFRLANSPVLLEINFLAESLHGDVVFILTISDENNKQSFYHSVIRKRDNSELCRMRIDWRKSSH